MLSSESVEKRRPLQGTFIEKVWLKLFPHSHYGQGHGGKTAQRFTPFLLPGIVLAVGLILTWTAFTYAKQQQLKLEFNGLERATNNVTASIEASLQHNEDLLIAVKGLFSASTGVSRVDFSNFMSAIDLVNRFPGILGVGWNPRILDSEVAAFETRVATDTSLNENGYPDFSVIPKTQDEEHYPLMYVEPMYRMERALGLDLIANEDRRQALSAAISTGKAVASAPYDLFKVPDGVRERMGFIVALPVFRSPNDKYADASHDNVKGVVSGAFMVETLLLESGIELFSGVEIFDITNASPHSKGIAFFTQGVTDEAFRETTQTMRASGRAWEMHFYTDPETLRQWADPSTKSIVLLLGMLVSSISALLVWVLVTSRNRAAALAATLTENLTRVNADLTRSNRDLSQFAYIASHDLQTPVRNVQTTVTLLKSRLDREDESIEFFLSHLEKSALRMQNLVEDLLCYARADGGETEMTEVDMNQLVRQSCERLMPLIDEIGASLEVDTLPVILGNADQLERVIINIITNAIKYRHGERALQISIVTERVAQGWKIGIHDNGLGIELKYQERVFEPFKRLHRHDDIEGTGLGLSICREILNNHGGDLTLCSAIGQGSEFSLNLPAYEQEHLKAA